MKLRHIFTALLVIVLLAGLGGLQNVRGENNGLERTPVLGWSGWSFLRKHPTAAKIEAQARALKNSGLQKIGYDYVNLDDFWYPCPGRQGPDVGPYGRWVIDSSRFPAHGDTNGIKAAADYVHGLGMKFGIYVTPGISRQAVSKNTSIKGTSYTADQIAEPSIAENNYNCGGMVRINFNKPGAQEFINSWADMLATWGVDYIKLDGVKNSNAADVKAWSNAIRQSGRPMVLDATQGSFTQAIAPTLIKYANQWEFPPDVECYRCEKRGSSYPLTSWANVEKRFNYVAEWQPYAGPGGFNDYDAIEVGNGSNDGLTPAERQTQLSLWALGSAPLILGVDLTHLNQLDLKYLKNTAVLAVDQDSIAAKRVLDAGSQQVFAKMEPNGHAIVGLFNTGEKAEKVSIQASAVGLHENEHGYSAQNLWTGKVEKTGGTISAVVPSHGVVLYRVKALRSNRPLKIISR
jgi:Alpha galactosidase A/Alpha galactosidase C-terminal beta sandwich domain